MALGATIPDPGTGNAVGNNFGSVEPNDSPGQATPLGVAMAGDVYTWVNNNKIGGGDTTDYFVFKSGPAASEFSLGAGGLCWMGAITNLSATLWKVTNHQQVLPAVHQWQGNGTCVKSTKGDAPLEPNTDYLFGVTSTGGAGNYNA